MKRKAVEKAKKIINKMHEDLLQQVLYTKEIDTENATCICEKCGWVDTGDHFTVATDGDDYDVICPNCYSGDGNIVELDD